MFASRAWPRLLLAACLLGTCISSFAEAAPRRKVIIDQDTYGPGGTNMQSVLMLLQSPEVDVLGITVSSGDGWRDEEVAQLLRMLEIVGRTDVPVYAGAVFPLLNSAARTQAWEMRYGRLNWKGAWTDVFANGTPKADYHADPFFVPPLAAGPVHAKVQAESATSFLVRTVRQHPGEVTIWAGGALTDLVLAAREDPQFARLVKELVFMGGSFNPVAAKNDSAAEYVNSPRREFNMFWDPEAASAALHEAWPKVTQVPVDPTTQTFFSKALFEEIGRAGTPVADYVSTYGRGFPMWDELAVAVWLDPTLVTRRQTLLVDVATHDDSAYGSTLSWAPGRGPHLGEREVEVVMAVDVARFERMTVQLLTRR